MEELVEYIDHKIADYLEKIERNNEHLRLHPKTRKVDRVEENALLKAKIEALREVKMYIRLLEEEEYES